MISNRVSFFLFFFLFIVGGLPNAMVKRHFQAALRCWLTVNPYGTGVYGTRITGGGFGGCTVTLVEKSQANALIEHVHKNYTLGKATCFVSAPADGAHAESL